MTEKYLARIEAVDKSGPAVNSVIEVNPDAAEIAESLDRERKEKGARGPLHGIPVLIKDNIDTADKMMTTAGSLALVDAPKPPRDSFVAAQLRKAGAVILGKTNLSEWANIRSSHSSSGWSGRGGPDAQSLRARSESLRLEFGHGRGHFRELRRRRDRHRDRWLDRLPVVVKWTGRDQAHRRARQPRWHRPHLAQPGHGRPDVPHAARCRHHAGSAHRGRSRGHGHEREPGQVAHRLHEVPRPQGSERRAHRRWRASISASAKAWMPSWPRPSTS